MLTGVPGVGKTTVLRKVAKGIRGRARGFLTDEIREKGRRVGFRIEALDGQRDILAHINLSRRSPHRVGRYGIDLPALDRMVDLMIREEEGQAVILIDEIGKMECFSKKFVGEVTRLLDSGRTVVAAVARKGGGFIERVKQRSDVELWEVTRENRDGLPEKVLAWLEELSVGGSSGVQSRDDTSGT